MNSLKITILFSSLLCVSLVTDGVGAGELTKQLADRKEKAGAKRSEKIAKIMQASTEQLEKSGLGTRAPNVGNRFPDETFLNWKKRKVRLSDFWKDGFAVVKFYRGHWCPYCQIELKSYQDQLEKFNKLNAKLIVFTPDTYRYINKTVKHFNLKFPVLSDKNNLFAKKLGIAFQLNPSIKKVYDDFKIDLKDAQDNSKQELPLPATYVVDKNGMVIYKFAKADYTLRADPEEVIEFIENHLKAQAKK